MSSAAPTKITINDEESAFVYFEAALREDFASENVTLVFDKWPQVSICVEGKGYDSTITPDLAQALVDLQQAMNRAYARAIHHTTNARSLTAEERRDIQFKAKVEKGSSLIKVDLGEYAQSLATALAGKMTAQDIVITVLGVSLIGGGYLMHKQWLKHRSEDKKVDAETKTRVALSQEETRRMEVFSRAMASRPQLEFAKEDFDDVRRELMRSVPDADKLTVQGVAVSAADARIIATSPRSESKDVQLNGHYVIQKIDWQHPEEVRLWLQSTDEKSLTFVATLKGASDMPAEKKDKLQSAEWGRKRLHMGINATRLRGEVTTASIVSVEWPIDKPSEDLPPG